MTARTDIPGELYETEVEHGALAACIEGTPESGYAVALRLTGGDPELGVLMSPKSTTDLGHRLHKLAIAAIKLNAGLAPQRKDD